MVFSTVFSHKFLNSWTNVYRLLAMLCIRVILPVILLFNPSFETVYRRTTADHQIIAGAAPFNVSYGLGQYKDIVLQQYFALNLQGLLRDPKIALPISPVTDRCANSGDCFSYALPGEFLLVAPFVGNINNATELLNLSHGDASVYIAERIPVFQVEFFPIQQAVSFSSEDCAAYGSAKLEIIFKLCFKNEGSDLVAGKTRTEYFASLFCKG